MLNRLKDSCKLCSICENSEGENPQLLSHESNDRRFLFVLDQSDSEYFDKISGVLFTEFENYSITFAKRCKGLTSDISLNTCGVYTKLLLKFFPIIWLGPDGAKQLSLQHEHGRFARVEGCIIYFGMNCVDRSELQQLKNIDADYANLKSLIGG